MMGLLMTLVSSSKGVSNMQIPEEPQHFNLRLLVALAALKCRLKQLQPDCI